MRTTCPDGNLDAGEVCDDGSANPFDCCTATCDVQQSAGAACAMFPDQQPGTCDAAGVCVPNCGNGVVDPGEDCDELASGCCMVSCQFAASGQTCGDDGDQHTLDRCDGAGTCTHPVNPCGNGVVEPPAESCDDGNYLFGDCCDPQCQAAPEFSVCNDDGDPHTPDLCRAGVCDHPACPLQMTSILDVCRTPETSLVKIRKGIATSGDKLTWKWKQAGGTPLTDFGSPPQGTGYMACVYANNQLVGGARVFPNNACGPACWRGNSRGFKFRTRTPGVDGMTVLGLQTTASTRIVVGGQGSGLDLPAPLALTAPVDVFLLRKDGYPPPLPCWRTTFPAATV
jgi:cysteine-rich repeat protein